LQLFQLLLKLVQRPNKTPPKYSPNGLTYLNGNIPVIAAVTFTNFCEPASVLLSEAVINLNAPTTTPTANANKPIAAPTGVAKRTNEAFTIPYTPLVIPLNDVVNKLPAPPAS
jgi:hypothetical protein